MKVRQLVTALLAAASVLAATTACQGDPIGPSPTPTAEETSARPTPTPSATPTPSFGANERKAITEAEAAYRAWLDLLDRMYKGPKAYPPERARTEIYKVGGDPAARKAALEFDNVRRAGLIQKGTLLLASVSPRDVNLITTMGRYPEVLLTSCTDSSKVDVVFEESGKPAGAPSEDTKFLRDIKVWYYEQAWHVVQDSTTRAVQQC